MLRCFERVLSSVFFWEVVVLCWGGGGVRGVGLCVGVGWRVVVGVL